MPSLTFASLSRRRLRFKPCLFRGLSRLPVAAAAQIFFYHSPGPCHRLGPDML